MNPDPKVKQPDSGTQEGAANAPIEVAIHDMAFNPRDVVIRAGQTVRWTNKEKILHTVIANPGPHGCQPASPEDFASYALEPDMDVETLFEKTGPAGRNRSQGGLGLGLYLCRLVVERSFGGRIWVAASGRGGTTFKFTVPARIRT